MNLQVVKGAARREAWAPDNIEELVVSNSSHEALEFIEKWVNIHDRERNVVLSTSTRFNVENIRSIMSLNSIVNLMRINDIRRINKFFESVNDKLPVGGKFIGCVETYQLRKQKIIRRFTPFLGVPLYCLDFMVRRVSPKLPVVKNVYFFLTKGRNRALSKAESLGRLYSCGFRVKEIAHHDNRLYFVAEKVGTPRYPKNPSYGPLFRMNRIGKNGKLIGVYKLRTMHAYSEFLQEYIYENNSLKDGGKFKNDFRITTLGKFFRKFWLDELPMLINLLNGDMKLVGVRPLSKHYLSLYTPELKEKRMKCKPGLIPPFYADMPKTLEEIMASELKYLNALEKSPILTDIRYFFKAMHNILIKKARSA